MLGIGAGMQLMVQLAGSKTEPNNAGGREEAVDITLFSGITLQIRIAPAAIWPGNRRDWVIAATRAVQQQP